MPRGVMRAGCALVATVAMLALSAPTAGATGAQRLLYRVGPFEVKPGQNDIGLRIIDDKPKVDGWITRIRPDLIYANGRVPGVDVLHLHHGVWLNLSRADATWPGLAQRFFAAGEEKTIVRFPKGYGYEYRASDTWLLNHMIHNLTPAPAQVYMVYELDFIPRTSAAARGMKPVRPIWMDVENGKVYPVFDVRKGDGSRGRFTYPADARRAYAGRSRLNQWEVDRDGVLIASAGHLHPGGLHTDLYLRRSGLPKRAHLFRSKAKYFEPAGAVSWDVAMTATRPGWRVEVRRGDVLSTSATYDSKRAAWWESMGIMITYMADSGRGRNPFRQRVDFPGRPTHGHLPENDNHGGRRAILPNPLELADGEAVGRPLDILSFRFPLGGLGLPGGAGRPPVVQRGQSITFRNADDSSGIHHSITSCKPPCNRGTGIAYPIADGRVQFESGTLGSAAPPATGRLEWQTPANLDPGTYTYFCRIHPFMRGAFRVK